MVYTNKTNTKKGFSLIEILVVVTILAILASIIYVSAMKFKEKAYYARAMTEFKTMHTALLLYYNDNRSYPDDVSRDIPSGLSPYLAGYNNNTWPDAPWPGSVYDWDNWDNPGLPGQKIFQISIRFCPIGGPLSACRFPDEPWAKNFGIDSSVYYCVAGSCRAHVGQPFNYPGYCVNCDVQPSP